MNRPLLCLILLVLGLAACKKKVEEQPSPEDSLRGGAWHRTSIKETFKSPASGKDTTIDVTDQVPDCVDDNRLQFNTNHDGVEQRGGNKCSAGDPDTAPFYWEMINAGTGLHIYNADETFLGNNGINADILTLTTNALTFRYRITLQDPLNPQADEVFTITEIWRR